MLLLLIVLSSGTGTVTQGVSQKTPQNYVLGNYDPGLNSTLNNEYYDANFIPGFQAGLTNVSVDWVSGMGYGTIDYSVGPWTSAEGNIPHLAVGPQCCNFIEVPHTQQFRQPSWGDYYYVRAGFDPPGVNVQNYTATFTTPADVGLRTDWNWTVQVSLDWSTPKLLDHSNEWGEVGVAATQYVTNFPGKLVYTVVNFWMDQNSSTGISMSSTGFEREVAAPNVVVYHPVQMSMEGNQTFTFNLSPYLADTLSALQVQPSQPPVISYVYLNTAGYNLEWNTTMWAFRVMAPSPAGGITIYLYAAGLVLAVSVSFAAYWFGVRPRSRPKP